MPYKQIILSKTNLLKYLKLRNIPYAGRGKILRVMCPICKKTKDCANTIPNTAKINCHFCKRNYTFLEIASKVEEKFPGDEESQIQYLKELLDVKVMTKKDETNIEKYLDFYVENGFDLVPIAKDDKRPIEKDWTNKEHKDKEEWQRWLADGLNIGIKTGTRSNITIIDIDQKPIPEEVKKLMGKTLMQESTKGYHLFYNYDKDLPKTRIDELKTDIENSGGQVVIYPSAVKGISRKLDIHKVIEIPKEFKKYLQAKITVPRKTHSELIREEIESEDFKINPKDLELKNNNLEGSCNSSFIKLGGILRKKLNIDQTGYVLHTLNKHLLETPMQSKSISAMIRELDKYLVFDEKELAHKILEYLKKVEEAQRTEIAMAIVGTNRGEEKKRVDLALAYLVKEGFILKKHRSYCIIKKAEWKTSLINIGIPIDFKMPYFDDVMNFNWGDLILIGSKNAKGKTHISMNIIKQLVEQGKNPYYLSLESGSRFIKIALQLGLKEPELKYDEVADASKIELESNNAITVIDWLCPNSYAEVDKLLMHFTKQLQKTKGIAIVFMQLRENNEWLAKDLVKQFPALVCRYIYDNEDSGEYGKFVIDKIRDPKLRIKFWEIPCQYDWNSKELKAIKDEDIPSGK